MNNDNRLLMVSIWCMAYNHENYIRQCLEGFVMQKTNFRFEAIVHDDASTDGTAAIVREYAEKYPDIIKPIFETENQYSKGNGALDRIMDENCTGKYIALCEGDDFWIDPLKLQKQVDYMDSHSECTMTCNRAKLFSVRDGKFIGEKYCRESDGELNPVDIINRTGLYIPTCSLMYRPEILKNYPDYCQNCNVGDYPLQITAAMKGYIYYFDKVMSVYRIDNPNSWAGKQKFNSIDPKRLHIVRSQMEMFKGFSKDYPKFQGVYNNKIAEHIIKNMPFGNDTNSVICYLNEFSNEIVCFDFVWKLVLFIYKCPVLIVRKAFGLIFLRKYMQLNKFY